MSKKKMWGLAFTISLLSILTVYGLAMDFEFLKYEVNEQNQLVMYEGLSGPNPIINSDVNKEQESLTVLGSYMSQFNRWFLAGILIAPFFIASYFLLFSEKWMGDHPKKKKYLSWTLCTNGVVIVVAVFIWVHYIEVVNNAFHNVLF
ncbi:hypothetical protein LC065_18065 [Halobacillus litoralis]|uniref:hypothetical protein n=1 Tax=Halobacillus litoralis TaxID=45668 RepID=UPI001CFE7877|nr:hypothetical protein [Halobacillus litoralis]WLR47397.1 hypothetical protein LC065_18065 [Halobacillus litoralis]